MEDCNIKRLIGLHGFASSGKTTVLKGYIDWLESEMHWKVLGCFNCSTRKPCRRNESYDFATVLSKGEKTVIVFTEGDSTECPQNLEELCKTVNERKKDLIAIVAMRSQYPNVLSCYSAWATEHGVDMVTILKRKLANCTETGIGRYFELLEAEKNRD